MRWSSLADLLPPALDAAYEGAWVALAYLTFQALGGSGAVLIGTPGFVVCAAVGLVLARRGGGSERAAYATAGVAVGLGLVGWLLDPGARAALDHGDVATALERHTAGLLAAVAVVRGTRHGSPVDDDVVVERSLAWMVPGAAVLWLVAQAAPSQERAAFTDQAFVATLTFATAALLALAVSRLESLGSEAGLDWRTNRSWLALLGGIVLVMALVGAAAAFLLGVPITSIVYGALGPLAVIVEAAFVAVALPIGILGTLVVAFLRDLLGAGRGGAPTGGPVSPGIPTYPEPGQPPVQLIAALLLVGGALAIVVLVVLFRRLRGSPEPAPEPVLEERTFAIPEWTGRVGLPRLGWRIPRPSRAPQGGVEAYVALLRALDGDPVLRRQESESPAAHAARLRRDGKGALALDLLAADYELVRYAGRGLTLPEDRRAVARWRALRARRTSG